MAKKGIKALDAPVSGGDIGAIQGTLTIMVGGVADALEQARPALEVVGKAITHIGEAGAGQVAKCCNQIMVAAQMTALSELLLFARKADVDPAQVIQAIRGGAAQCWAIDNKAEKLLAGDRRPGFKAYMQSKDMGIVMEELGRVVHPGPCWASCVGATAAATLFSQDSLLEHWGITADALCNTMRKQLSNN